MLRLGNWKRTGAGFLKGSGPGCASGTKPLAHHVPVETGQTFPTKTGHCSHDSATPSTVECLRVLNSRKEARDGVLTAYSVGRTGSGLGSGLYRVRGRRCAAWAMDAASRLRRGILRGDADNGLADLPIARTVAVVAPSSWGTGLVSRRSPLVGRHSWRTGSLWATVAGVELGWPAAPAGIGCPLTSPLHRSQRLGPWDDGLAPTTPRWRDVPAG